MLKSKTECAIEYMGEMDGFIYGNTKYDVFGECTLQERKERIVKSIREFFPWNVSGLEHFYGCLYIFKRPNTDLSEDLKELCKGLHAETDDTDMFSGGTEVDDWLAVAEHKEGALNKIKYLAMSVYHAFKDGSRRTVANRLITGLDKKILFLNMLEEKAHRYLEFNEKYIPFCEETMNALGKTMADEDYIFNLSRMSLKVRGLKRDVNSLQGLLKTIDMRRKSCIERRTRLEKIIR